MDAERDPLAAVEFGRFKVVPHRREITVDGAPITLTGLPSAELGESLLRLPSHGHAETCSPEKNEERPDRPQDEAPGASPGQSAYQ